MVLGFFRHMAAYFAGPEKNLVSEDKSVKKAVETTVPPATSTTSAVPDSLRVCAHSGSELPPAQTQPNPLAALGQSGTPASFSLMDVIQQAVASQLSTMIGNTLLQHPPSRENTGLGYHPGSLQRPPEHTGVSYHPGLQPPCGPSSNAHTPCAAASSIISAPNNTCAHHDLRLSTDQNITAHPAASHNDGNTSLSQGMPIIATTAAAAAVPQGSNQASSSTVTPKQFDLHQTAVGTETSAALQLSTAPAASSERELQTEDTLTTSTPSDQQLLSTSNLIDFSYIGHAKIAVQVRMALQTLTPGRMGNGRRGLVWGFSYAAIDQIVV
ncbi:hypothetical protein EIP86_009069 [Pleurotus ostreatoroseus]|nr:hypothetical protein EIP86_009069 [Pleurotus ostreatoroseus]